jgi:hypothetical protein
VAIDFSKKKREVAPSKELTRSELFNLINAAIDNGTIKSKDLYALESRANKSRFSTGTNKPRIKLEDSLLAYKYVLDNICTVDEALCYSMEYSTLDEEALIAYVKLAKNNKTYKIKTNVTNNDEYAVQKYMIKYKCLNRKALSKCKTPNEQLTELIYQKSQYERILKLQSDNSTLRKSVNDLTINKWDQEKRITFDKLVSEIKEKKGTINYIKELASILKSQGQTQEHIAKTIGKSLRTIKRWWNKL